MPESPKVIESVIETMLISFQGFSEIEVGAWLARSDTTLLNKQMSVANHLKPES